VVFLVPAAITKNGHALLLINPHTSFFLRSELQMSSDNGLNAYGSVSAAWIVVGDRGRFRHRTPPAARGRAAPRPFAGLVYLAAASAIIAYVFDLPIQGSLATSGAMAIVLGLALQSTLGDFWRSIKLQQWYTAAHEGRRNRRSCRQATAGSTRPFPPVVHCSGSLHSRPAALITPRNSIPLRLNSGAPPDGV